MKQILIGFMGSGKTQIAKKLGELLAQPVVEMDELVLQRTAAKSMHELFARGGEQLLRQSEAEVAKSYAGANNMIISTGGGVIVNDAALDSLKQGVAKVIFLHASFEKIAARLLSDCSRPLFVDRAKAKALYHYRLPLYLQHADLVVDVGDKSVEQIAAEIAS